MRTAPIAFEIIRLVGVAYLLWLGVGILRAHSLTPATQAPASGGRSYLTAARRGLLTNISNPKALLFCSVLLPQFIGPDHGPVAWQFLLLGAILVVTGAAFDILYTLVGASVGRWVSRCPLAQRLQRWVFASLLI